MHREDGRDVNTLDLHKGFVYENVSSVIGTPCPIFAVNRKLSMREWIPLMDITVPFTLIPGDFIVPITQNISIEKALELIDERTMNSLVHDILRRERYSLRNERKRPWAMQTRRPFRGIIDKVQITFSDRIELAEKAVEEIGAPWEISKRGRKPIYDPKKLGAAIVAKGSLSYVDLAGEIRAIEYDMTIKGIKKYPCASELHHVFDEKIPKEWLEKALARFDELSVELFSKFEEKLNRFVIDGSALTCETLEKKYVAMEWKLIREYHKYTALIRTTTNTIRGIKESTNRIRDFLPLIPLDSEVTADPEFDVENNYRDAKESTIDLQIKQRKGDVRKSCRKRARAHFDRKKYGKRKLGERPFGNIEVRRYKNHYRKTENRQKGVLIAACDHNIIQYYKNKSWCELFVKVRP